MKSLPDSIAPLARTRAEKACHRPDVAEIEFPEIELEVTVRPPTQEEWWAYMPGQLDRARRSAARYALLARCLVYPCDAAGEPDLAALKAAVDELPALVTECLEEIDNLATGAPLASIVPSDDTAAICKELLGPAFDDIRKAHKRFRVVAVSQGLPVRAVAVKAPSRASYEAFEGATNDDLCERAYHLALDCIVSMEATARDRLLELWPGLPTMLFPIIETLAGSRRMANEPRKKVRSASYGS